MTFIWCTLLWYHVLSPMPGTQEDEDQGTATSAGFLLDLLMPICVSDFLPQVLIFYILVLLYYLVDTSLVLSDLSLLWRIVHFIMFSTSYVHGFPQFPRRQTFSLLFSEEETGGRRQYKPSFHRAGWRENQSYPKVESFPPHASYYDK